MTLSESDLLLVHVLGATDALFLPVRDWRSGLNAAAHLGRELYAKRGVPTRVGGAAADRKAGERLLTGLADAGLLVVARDRSEKFPGCRLTAAGEARARALACLPDVAKGLAFVARVDQVAAGYAMGHCPEIDLNDGKGWGLDATREERGRLSLLELKALPALVRGWATSASTIEGHAVFQSLPRAINPKTGESLDPLKNAKGRERETGAALAAADELATLFDRAELSERYRDVVMRRLGLEEPREEIAADLGVSGTRVREMVAIAREKLRDVAEIG